MAKHVAKSGVAVGLAALLGAGLWWSTRSSNSPSSQNGAVAEAVRPAPATPAPLEPISPPAKSPQAANPAAPLDPKRRGSRLAKDLNANDGSGQADVDVLDGMVRQYLRILKSRPGRPIGNDSDLAHVLTGHNPMHLVLLPQPHPALGSDGRLRDRWGTPYFIHPRSARSIEVRSAGPDRRLFTADDIVPNRTELVEDAPGPDPDPQGEY